MTVASERTHAHEGLGTGTGQRLPSSRLPRIRLRFTLLYVLTLLLVLLSAAGVLRYALRETLAREFRESVIASAALVQQFFRTEIHELRTTEGTILHVTEELIFEDRAIRVRRPDGSVVGDSVSLARRTERFRHVPMRVVGFPLDPVLAPGYQVEVMASLANVRSLQDEVDRWFLFGIPVLALLAAGVGWWLTGRTLRPVGVMADAALGILPGSGSRLPTGEGRDEIERLGLRFNALLDRLDGALAQQRRFLADAAHELRTPIARMRARVELALLNNGPSESEVLETIDLELRRVSQQVDELMQLAQADAMGDTVPVFRRLFLDDLIADELARWGPQAEKLQLRLGVDRLDEAPIMGDRALLARLVGILVDNALRYSSAGGSVVLSVWPENGMANLEVDDEGSGVPEGERGQIFERFYRGEDARKKRPDGSGLGLAIARWIVERHKGRIQVTNSGRGGARFCVSLPLVNERGAGSA